MSDPINNPNPNEPVLPPGVPPAGNPPVLPPGYVPPTPPVPPVQPVAPVPPTPVAAPESGELPSTGNAILDTSIAAFASVTGATTADMQRAVANALAYGDPSLIDTQFIKDKFGKHADQALQLAQAVVAEQGASKARAVNQVHELAGGQQQWDQAVSVFNTNAPDYVKIAVKTMLDSGQIEAGSKLLLETVRAGGLLPNVNAMLPPGTPGAGTNGALGKAEFQTEMQKLKQEAGSRSLESGVYGQRYQELMNRRAVGRQMGLN